MVYHGKGAAAEIVLDGFGWCGRLSLPIPKEEYGLRLGLNPKGHVQPDARFLFGKYWVQTWKLDFHPIQAAAPLILSIHPPLLHASHPTTASASHHPQVGGGGRRPRTTRCGSRELREVAAILVAAHTVEDDTLSPPGRMALDADVRCLQGRSLPLTPPRSTRLRMDWCVPIAKVFPSINVYNSWLLMWIRSPSYHNIVHFSFLPSYNLSILMIVHIGLNS
ncbi:hypothetical protein SEVIR_8G154301v4 [Setaria viridis]